MRKTARRNFCWRAVLSLEIHGERRAETSHIIIMRASRADVAAVAVTPAHDVVKIFQGII